MPRKPRKIGIHTIRNFGDIVLRLDASDGTFEAEVHGKTLTDATRAGLIAKIDAAVKQVLALEWKPAIEVRGLRANGDYRGRDDEVEVRVKLERFWVARKAGGGWVECDWEHAADRGVWDRDEPIDRRTERARDSHHDFDDLTRPIKRRTSNGYGDAVYHLPYSDETWAALQDILVKMRQLDAALAKLIGTSAGYAKLSAGQNTLLLTAPALEEEPDHA